MTTFPATKENWAILGCPIPPRQKTQMEKYFLEAKLKLKEDKLLFLRQMEKETLAEINGILKELEA